MLAPRLTSFAVEERFVRVTLVRSGRRDGQATTGYIFTFTPRL